MTSSLSPLQVLDYYLSLGIDQAISFHPVLKVGADIQPLPKFAFLASNEKQKEKAGNSSAMPKVADRKSVQSLSKGQESMWTGVDLSAITSLEDLRQAMLKDTVCSLKETALNTVFGDGNPQASVMLIGEAPGADEDRLGKPFVGVSGQLLDKMMATIGLTRDNFYITNIIPWRPPANRQPSVEEIRLCLPFVKKHIELIRPQVLIFVGGTAAKALLDTTEGIMRLRGRWLTYTALPEQPTAAFAIYHPAYLLRSPGQKKVAWQDMVQVKQKLIQFNILTENHGL